MSNQVSSGTFVNLVSAMYGADFVNAKRVINSKVKNQQPNPKNLTLAERILLNRRKEQQQQHRRDSPAGSVDISDLTNQNDERKTPTPEPTLAETARRSPLKKQDSRRSLVSEPQAGPSNRQSATPPLPPIKTASPKQESRPQSIKPESRRSNVVESRKQTPVLPPIARRESRASRASNKDDGADDIQPPKDTREFDPNLGVGTDSEEPVSQSETPKPVKPEAPLNSFVEAKREEIQETKAKAPTPKPQTPQARKEEPVTEKVLTPRPRSPDKTVIVPVVAAAAQNTRSRSRSRSRRKSKSRSRSRSRKRSRSPRKRSRRKSRHRSSSSESRSSSRRRHRRSKSRKRHRSLSYSSSPRRRRRYSSSSEGRRRHSRGRSRSRRRSFDYDFERAKSIIRSLSRVGEFPRQRPYEQPIPNYAYPMYAGNPAYPPYPNNPMYWPTGPRPESPKRKKQIIIVKDGQVSTGKRRNNSSSESDVSVIVQDGKNKGKKGKVRRVSVSESDSDNGQSKSRNRKKKGKKVNFVTKASKHEVTEDSDEESDSEINVKTISTKNNKSKKTKNGGQKQQKETTDNDSSHDEPETKENIPKIVAVPKTNKSQAVVEQHKEVHAAARRPTPREALQAKSPNSQNKSPTPRNTPSSRNGPDAKKPAGKKTQSKEDLELQEALEQLDKQADYELDQLKGSNSRKPPPSVNSAMQKKIFSKEFQANMNKFLSS